jgi:DNA-binding transcriptional MerR regulator
MYLSDLDLTDKKYFLELAYYVSTCDNELHLEEIKVLMRLREEMSLSEFIYQIQEKNIDRVIDQLAKSSQKSKKGMFLEIMNLIVSDRKYDENEIKIAEKLATIWELIPEESLVVLKWIRDLYLL